MTQRVRYNFGLSGVAYSLHGMVYFCWRWAKSVCSLEKFQGLGFSPDSLEEVIYIAESWERMGFRGQGRGCTFLLDCAYSNVMAQPTSLQILKLKC